MRIIDLTHPVEHGMQTYPNLPGPQISEYQPASRPTYAEGTRFHFSQVDMLGNTGTWVDAPRHRFAEGKDIAELPLVQLAHVPGVCFAVAAEQRSIDVDLFQGHSLEGKAVLIHTGWSRHWRTPRYAEKPPFLTGAAAHWLVQAGISFLAIDSLNVDDLADASRPVHTRLLEAGIPIGEHFTNLDQLPAEGFWLHAVPAKLRGMSTFPVRAYALCE
jgi:kynurenine formamidase